VTNRSTARAYVDQAALVLDEAHSLHRRGAWNLVVRRCQEAVELALKGALRAVGVEVPRVHDVGGTLRQHTQRFPPHLGEVVPELVSISRRLGRERELAFYGDEDTDTPPQELYGVEDAQRALADADRALSWAREVLAGLGGPGASGIAQ
jgi:HEPN domain-containing protein